MTSPFSGLSWHTLRGVAGTLIVALVLFLAGIYLRDRWQDIEVYASEIEWLDVGLAAIGFSLGMALLPIGSWFLFRYGGFQISAKAIWQAFYLSQVAKYLPGSIWSLPGRVYLYSRFGIPLSQSTAIVAWETGLMVVGAAVLVALFPALTFGTSFLPITLVAIGGLILVVLLITRLLARPGFLEWAQTGTPVKRPFAALASFIPTSTQITVLIIVYTLTWLALGLAFAQTAQAVSDIPDLETWLNLSALHAATWIVGFLVIIAPGGIGVRDTLLVLGAAKIFDAPAPIIIAGLARLLWTVAELVGLLLTQLSRSTFHFARRNQELEG